MSSKQGIVTVTALSDSGVQETSGRYRAAKTSFDEYPLYQFSRRRKSMPRGVIILLCVLGAAMLLLAVALQISALALPYWLILPNIPPNNVNPLQPGLTSSFYSGLWQFCGYTADTDVFSNHRFCMPAEIYNPTAVTQVIKFNGLTGDWRRTTQGMALASTFATLIATVAAFLSVCTCCSETKVGKAAVIVWSATSLLSLVFTCVTLIYFVITFQQDQAKMFYNAGGTTIYERNLYVSFYLFVAAVGGLFLSLTFAAVTIGVALTNSDDGKLTRSTYPKSVIAA